MSAFQLVSRLSSRPGWDAARRGRPAGSRGCARGSPRRARGRATPGRSRPAGPRGSCRASVAPNQAIAVWRVGAEDLAQLVERPDVGQPLDAVGVGVQRAAEPAVLGGHLAQRPVERLLRRPPQHGVAGDLPGVDVRAGQQRVVVEHLLEVRDRPGRVGAVAVEAAADLVEDPAAGHRPQREEAHRRLAAGQQQLDDRRRRELRRAAPAAVDAVEAPAQRLDGLVERLGRERSVGRPQQRAAGQPRRHPLRPARGSRRGGCAQASSTASSTWRQLGSPCRGCGGKYVPPKNGTCSGVAKTFSGQPPWPVIACTASM